MKIGKRTPIHPGEILQDELEAHGMGVEEFSKNIQLDPYEVKAVLLGHVGIDDAFAEALGGYFKTSAQFWLNLQSTYDQLKKS